MSRGKSKPIFLDEETLMMAIVEHSPQYQAGRVAMAEGIHFNEVVRLRLGWRKILKIDLLWEFTLLTKLELNNNLIQKIEGLDLLNNLTWLNLSFNKIEKIEGLDSLLKLEVLNLSNNSISVIENMDTLEKLTIFSMANNLLTQLDNVLYLRKFKKLFSVILSGNPISEEGDYKCLVAAYFPNLAIHDNKVLRNENSDKYQYAVEEMEYNEAKMALAAEADRRQEAELQLHTEAFVELLNGPYLFENMFKDDPELEKLKCIAGVANLLEIFKHQITGLCVQLFEIGLAEHKRRETEMNLFFSSQTEVITDYQHKTAEILADIEKQHEKWIIELEQISDPELMQVKFDQCKDEINKFSKTLMTLEFHQDSHLEEIIKIFDINISDMVGSFSKTAQGIFANCRDLQDNYYEKVQEIAATTLEIVAEDIAEDSMPEDVRILFTDKDTVMDALATSHENHLLRINDRETQLVIRANAWKESLIEGIQDKELKRNRLFLSDIHRYMDFLMEKLKKYFH